jgi:hypothetical protein
LKSVLMFLHMAISSLFAAAQTRATPDHVIIVPVRAAMRRTLEKV